MRPLRLHRATGRDPARDAADPGHGATGFLDTMPFVDDDEGVPAVAPPAPPRIDQALAHFEHAASALSATARMTRRPEDPARRDVAPGGPRRLAPKPAAPRQDASAPPVAPARSAPAAATVPARATSAPAGFAASGLEPARPVQRPMHAVSWTAAPTRPMESDADGIPEGSHRATLPGSTRRRALFASTPGRRRSAFAIAAAAMAVAACFVAWARQAVVPAVAPPPAQRAAGPGSAGLGASPMSHGTAEVGELAMEPPAAGRAPATAAVVPVMDEAPAPVAPIVEADTAPAAAPMPVPDPPVAAHRPAPLPDGVSAAVAAAQAKADKFLRDGGGPAAPAAEAR